MSVKGTLLREGDVIELRNGHTVYVWLPEHFVYSNRLGVFDKCARTEAVIGELKNGMDTAWLRGRYVVVATAQDGGGSMGANDVYPSGHHVTAERLVPANGVHQPRWRIEFYQTGSFTAMIPDIAPIGRATARWTEHGE